MLSSNTQSVSKGDFKKWMKSDATQTLWIEKIIGVAFAPVFLFWSGLLFVFSLGLMISLGFFKLLASLLGGQRKEGL